MKDNLRKFKEDDLYDLPKAALIDICCIKMESLQKRGIYLCKETEVID